MLNLELFQLGLPGAVLRGELTRFDIVEERERLILLHTVAGLDEHLSNSSPGKWTDLADVVVDGLYGSGEDDPRFHLADRQWSNLDTRTPLSFQAQFHDVGLFDVFLGMPFGASRSGRVGPCCGCLFSLPA